MRATVFVAVALALGLAFGATACGGGGAGTQAASTSSTPATPIARHAQSGYVIQMRKLGSALSASIQLVANADAKANTAPATVAANLAKVQKALRRAAVALARIQPPPRVRSDHALLLRGVREYESELDGIIGRLRGGQVVALRAIPTLRGVRDMQRASYAIVQKGYAIVG